MPHSKTIERAISVTFSRSFAAPFVTRPKTTSSAARPASATIIRSIELLLRVEVAVLLGQVERVAERVAARDDRHLLQLHRGAHQVRHQRVAALVVGEDAPLLLGQHLLLLQAGDDALERVVEVRSA